jgi:hypothetical protein
MKASTEDATVSEYKIDLVINTTPIYREKQYKFSSSDTTILCRVVPRGGTDGRTERHD